MRIAFYQVLALLFIALKLTNVIDWSWWWVTSPLWIGGILLGLNEALVQEKAARRAGCAK